MIVINLLGLLFQGPHKTSPWAARQEPVFFYLILSLVESSLFKKPQIQSVCVGIRGVMAIVVGSHFGWPISPLVSSWNKMAPHTREIVAVYHALKLLSFFFPSVHQPSLSSSDVSILTYFGTFRFFC